MTERMSNVDTAHRLSNLTNQCLDAISTHVDEADLSSPGGRFASHFFTFSSCAADLYLSLGKLETAKKLFAVAIDHIRTTQAEESSDPELMRLLRGFAECNRKTGDLAMAQEALQSALAIAGPAFGPMSDEAFEIAARLKTVVTSMATDRGHHKRALMASSGCKLRRRGTQSDIANPRPSSSTITPSHATVLKAHMTEIIIEGDIECQLLLAKPVIILPPRDMPNSSVSELKGAVRLRVFRDVNTGAVTVTLRCISTIGQSGRGGHPKIIYCRKKVLELRELEDFDFYPTARAHGWLAEGTYVCSFGFMLINDDDDSLQTSHGSIRWELEATFEIIGQSAAPLLRLAHEIIVIRDPTYPIYALKRISQIEKWNNYQFEVSVSTELIPLGGVIRAKIKFSSPGNHPERSHVRCDIVQDDMAPSQKPSRRRVSLLREGQSIGTTCGLWDLVPENGLSQSVVVYLQLPTCRQMRHAQEQQLNPSRTSPSATVKHYLEVSSKPFWNFKCIT